MKRFLISIFLLGNVVGVKAQAFTPGSLVVLKVDGTSVSGTNPAAPVSLAEYNSTTPGAPIQTINIPNTIAADRLTIPINSQFDGLLNLSTDGRYLTFAGYDVSPGFDLPNEQTATMVNRVIGRIDYSGAASINLSTKIPSGFDGNAGNNGSIRSAITTNGTGIWASGQTQTSEGAIRYTTFGGTGSVPITATSNMDSRALGIFDGQLYISSASSVGGSHVGINKVGIDTPMVGSNAYTLLTGTDLNGPVQFIMFDVNKFIAGPDLMYVADAGAGSAGVWKFSYNGFVWQQSGHLTGSAAGLTGFRNCDGKITLFVAQAGATNNGIYKVMDDGIPFSNITGNTNPFTSIGTLFIAGASNIGYRGLAMAPVNTTVVGTTGFPLSGPYDMIVIKNGGSAILMGNVSVKQKIIIENGGILDMADKVITSEGGINNSGFELRAGGFIKIGHTQGIAATAAAGNVQTCSRIFPDNANYEYNGTVPQSTGDGLPISLVAGTTLKINNTSGIATAGVSFNNDMDISGTLDLSNGKLTMLSGTLFISDNAIAINHSGNSFVNGPVTKTGDDSFVFPIGLGSIYAPLGMTNAGPADINDEFTATYFRSNPQSDYGPATSANLDHVSYVEYWTLNDQTFSPSAKNISLDVHQESFCKELVNTYVARWNGAIWNKVNTTIASGPVVVGLYQTGTVITTTSSSDFSDPLDAFTLSTDRPFSANPLPINLISFDANKLTANKSLVTWELAACCSAAAKFELQRAGDDKNFTTISIIGGSETNRNYSYNDNGLKTGINYYRLKMIDADGTITYSRTVAIMNGVKGLLLTSLIPTVVNNTATLTIASSGSQKLEIIVIDMQGRVMMKQNHTVGEGNTTIHLSLEKLPAGMYQLIGVSTEGKTNTIRFMK